MSEQDIRETGNIDDAFGGMDPRTAEKVAGVTRIGYLEDELNWCGHTFGLRTLKGDEELNAGLAVKKYMGTPGQAKAWAWAQVALALTSVDGRTDFCPKAGPSSEEYAKARFRYLTSEWHWPTIEALYAAFVELQGEADVGIQALLGKSESDRSPSSASLDFLTDPVD